MYASSLGNFTYQLLTLATYLLLTLRPSPTVKTSTYNSQSYYYCCKTIGKIINVLLLLIILLLLILLLLLLLSIYRVNFPSLLSVTLLPHLLMPFSPPIFPCFVPLYLISSPKCFIWCDPVIPKFPFSLYLFCVSNYLKSPRSLDLDLGDLVDLTLTLTGCHKLVLFFFFLFSLI